jgi:hypothetical protein
MPVVEIRVHVKSISVHVNWLIFNILAVFLFLFFLLSLGDAAKRRKDDSDVAIGRGVWCCFIFELVYM